jgi:uncharacterized phage protein (TIGR01671 family)
MQREIKFRCWDVQGQKMFIPKEIPNDMICSVPEDDDEQFFVHMQFTGLKDKNGKEIYEVDILEFTYHRDRSGNDIVKFTRVVEWEEMDNSQGWGITQKMHHIVIGNIYETPQLLNP